MKIDILKFIFIYEQSMFKELSDKQKDALTDLLEFIELDESITDYRHAAYMLATTKHETADTFRPIAEYGKGKGMKYGKPAANGKIFYGRGFVQLTWADNYKTMGSALKEDLYNNPDKAMQPFIAYHIMSLGMRKGMFTGVGLSKYINKDRCDYVNARKIINGLDCAEKIAGYAKKFEMGLKETVEV